MAKDRKVGNRYSCHWCKKRFKLAHLDQVHCCIDCVWREYTGTSSHHRWITKAWARAFGFRSMQELGFQVALDDQGISKRAEYEPEVFKWTPKVRRYTPDWRITRPDGSRFYLEFKGKLDQTERSKLIGIKASLPDLDLRLVFPKPNNKLSSKSKTRYWEWAEKNGFPWMSAYQGMPKEWLR